MLGGKGGLHHAAHGLVLHPADNEGHALLLHIAAELLQAVIAPRIQHVHGGKVQNQLLPVQTVMPDLPEGSFGGGEEQRAGDPQHLVLGARSFSDVMMKGKIVHLGHAGHVSHEDHRGHDNAEADGHHHVKHHCTEDAADHDEHIGALRRPEKINHLAPFAHVVGHQQEKRGHG